MTPGDWIAILGVAVALLLGILPLLAGSMRRKADAQQRIIDKQQAVIDKQAETIDRQRETIIDYKIAQRELGGTAESVRRLLGALPIAPPDGSGT